MRHASATEEPPITNDTINLHTLMEKTPGADLLREMIGFAAQRLMELEVEGQTGARPTAKRARSVCRSATMTFDRIWENPRRWRRTAHLQAAQELLLPRFLESRRTAEKALTARKAAAQLIAYLPPS